jgi:hypothetical protein
MVFSKQNEQIRKTLMSKLNPELDTPDGFDAEEQLLLLAKRVPAWKGLLRCCAAAYRAKCGECESKDRSLFEWSAAFGEAAALAEMLERQYKELSERCGSVMSPGAFYAEITPTIQCHIAERKALG